MASLLAAIMVGFKQIELTDQAWIEKAFAQKNCRSCDYAFSTQFMWRDYYHTEVAQIDGDCVIKAVDTEECFLFPAGNGDIRTVLESLKAYCAANGRPLVFHGVLKEDLELLEQLYPGQIQAQPIRAAYDYLYANTDLIDLPGKKYHGKRNHLKRFFQNNWSFEPITKDNIDECRQMSEEWCKGNKCASHSELTSEMCAVGYAFSYFEPLGLVGGLIRVDSRVVGFSMGRPLNEDTFVVHIEKAFSEVEGAYPAINHEFSAYAAKQFPYINREDDVGAEGLRRAKLSYYPTILLEKYNVRVG